jgi:hypothetical protein
MYRAIDVWKRMEDGRAARYRCFEALATGRFCVQSCDFYDKDQRRDVARDLERQAIELMVDGDPVERAGSYATLQEAIEAHDAEFKVGSR